MAQFAERSLLLTEIRGSIPVMGKVLYLICFSGNG